MKSWVEVHSGAFLGVFHGAILALRRHSVNFAATVDVRSNAPHEPRLTATDRSDSEGRERSSVGLHAVVRRLARHS